MTSTLTRPSPAAADDEPVVPGSRRSQPLPGTWLTTGDHKRLGLLYIYGGLAAVLATCISAALFFVRADLPDLWTSGGIRYASFETATAFLIGIPALWIGLATYVVPLQIGATRLALPRFHNFSLWLYAVGGALTTVGFLSEKRTISSLATSLPQAANGTAPKAVQLAIVGLILVAVAITMAAISLLVTVLNRRADGLRLVYLPLFSWSTLATASVFVLAVPTLIAGLLLLFLDQHYGGTLLGGAGSGSRRIWQHLLWIAGQPLGLVFSGAAVGLFCDVVATHARRPLAGFGVARVATVAAPFLSLLLWAQNTSVLSSPFGPTGTVGGVVVFVPLLLALLTWAGTFKGSKPKAHSSLLYVVLFLALIGLAKALSIVAIFVGVEGADAEAFRNGQLTLLTFGAPLLAFAAGAAHWSPKLWGRAAAAGPSALQGLLLFTGAVLLSMPGYLIGLGADDAVVPLGIAGAVAVAAGVLLFALDIFRRGAVSDGDPYEGQTLEWATSSPPAAYNFEELPDIRSPHPLTDARAAATGPGGTAE
jgi:cytochrome c oxidase subunit 1